MFVAVLLGTALSFAQTPPMPEQPALRVRFNSVEPQGADGKLPSTDTPVSPVIYPSLSRPPVGLMPVWYAETTGTSGNSSAPESGTESKPSTEPKRRAFPGPFMSPPMPSAEWQGFPLVGIPPGTTRWPLMKAMQGTWYGDVLDSSRTRVYGWINGSANLSTSRNSTP
jgi:hypothetical protein